MSQCVKQHRNAQAFSASRPSSSARQLSVRVFNQQHPSDAKHDQKTFGDIARRAGAAAMSGLLTLSVLTSGAAYARPAGVNRPELLPAEQTPVIDVAGFLTPSEEKRIANQVEALEQDTGFRLRLLAQNYPETPGLAIRDFWGVDDTSIVFVADPTFGDILNFNVGQAVDLEVPQSFWSRLAGKYGNKFYWQEKGEAASILSAVNAIDACLREPSGRAKCATVQGGLEQ
ncbi:hypothetical protein COO60DRAFT_1699448 [Scenedesmus sp. NREL 46B-D3]|nr:hypothetical protein COO60DRAFT_1699448 [Scenedesmus sp. NREL 46B-D3]